MRIDVNHTSMDNIVVVEIIHSFKDLPYCLGSVFLRKLSVFAYSVKELSTGSQLRNDIVFVLAKGRLEIKRLIIGLAVYTLDSNQSWNRTMCGCFILCNNIISS